MLFPYWQRGNNMLSGPQKCSHKHRKLLPPSPKAIRQNNGLGTSLAPAYVLYWDVLVTPQWLALLFGAPGVRWSQRKNEETWKVTLPAELGRTFILLSFSGRFEARKALGTGSVHFHHEKQMVSDSHNSPITEKVTNRYNERRCLTLQPIHTKNQTNKQKMSLYYLLVNAINLRFLILT